MLVVVVGQGFDPALLDCDTERYAGPTITDDPRQMKRPISGG